MVQVHSVCSVTYLSLTTEKIKFAFNAFSLTELPPSCISTAIKTSNMAGGVVKEIFDSFPVARGMVICRHCKWFTCCWSIYSSTRVWLTSSPVVHTESFQNWSRPMCSKPYPLAADHRSNLLWLWCTTTNDDAYCWRLSSDKIPERSSGSTSCWWECTHLARHAKQTIKKERLGNMPPA